MDYRGYNLSKAQNLNNTEEYFDKKHKSIFRQKAELTWNSANS